MCGIFGAWFLGGEGLQLEPIQLATSSLWHRGPDDEGYLLVNVGTGDTRLCAGTNTDPALLLPLLNTMRHEAFDFAFGFRRLAILDLSPAGHQPMASEDGRFWIVFNGEIYNYVELRAELSGYGYQFQSGTDTEVILAAYDRWGEQCLSRFNGMWALAIWDHHKRHLFLARDHFGIKPLYYVHHNGYFSFASEIKALVGPHGRPFEPDEEAVFHYITSGMLPSALGGKTFFKGVRSLPPGHSMVIQSDGRLIVSRYWSVSTIAHSPGPTDLAVEQCRTLLTDSVRLRLRADVPIGTCLSGGLDSSSIVGIIGNLLLDEGLDARQIGNQQKAFSAVYHTDGSYNERAHIEKVLRCSNAEGNYTFPTAERLWQDLSELVWHQDEPFLSTSIFAQWCVMQLARARGVTVLLDGQGADEALGGYHPFDLFIADLIRHGQWRRATQELRAIRQVTGASLPPILARSLLWQLPQSLVQTLRQRHHQGSRWLLEPDFLEWSKNVTEAPPPNRQSLQLYLSEQVMDSHLPHLLRYEDRNSMAFGIEARVPFLDHRIVEFAFAEGASLRIRQGWTKWVLREAMAGIVPEEIIWRRDKVGFATPEATWLQQLLPQLSSELWTQDALSSSFIDVKQVAAAASGNGQSWSDATQLWRAINLEMWLRVWSSPPVATRAGYKVM